MKRVLILLLLCAPAWGANDFTLDANCVSLWKFDTASWLADSISTNTLANFSMSNNNSLYKEGDASADSPGTLAAYLQITDASLSAGFPWKKNVSSPIFSVCFWFRMDTVPAEGDSQALISKWHAAFGERQWLIQVSQGSGTVRVGVLQGYNNGASNEFIGHAAGMNATTWYHVGITYVDATKAMTIRIWDDTGGAILGTDISHTFTNNVNTVDAATMLVGNAENPFNPLIGNVDEMVFFNDVLTADEIDEIRLGTYGAPAATGTSDWWYRRRHN